MGPRIPLPPSRLDVEVDKRDWYGSLADKVMNVKLLQLEVPRGNIYDELKAESLLATERDQCTSATPSLCNPLALTCHLQLGSEGFHGS